jgi:hypothetical protein
MFGMDSSSVEEWLTIQQPKIAPKPLHSIYACSGHLKNAKDYTNLENLENNDQQIYRLCHNPYQFYKEIQELRGQLPRTTDMDFNPYLLFLKVCPCKKMDNDLRVALEDSATDLLKQYYPLDSVITIVSVGPGGAYQELVFIAKLVQAGFKKLLLVLIDPADVMVGALSRFCDEHLPQCHIEFYKYNKLEDYYQTAINQENLKPNLLLIDLTDDRFKIENKTLNDYCFHLLQEKQLFKVGTVIAYSAFEIGFKKFTIKAICCSYDENSSELQNIKLNRKEFVRVLGVAPQTGR